MFCENDYKMHAFKEPGSIGLNEFKLVKNKHLHKEMCLHPQPTSFFLLVWEAVEGRELELEGAGGEH